MTRIDGRSPSDPRPTTITPGYLAHAEGSGWTPEGEGLLRKRLADSGAGWLDAATVDLWSAYMDWLKRPMIFNGSDWGVGDAVLRETTLETVVDNV